MATTTTPTTFTSLDLPVGGMDCADCTAYIERSVRALPAVYYAQVLIAAERATVSFDPAHVTPGQIKAAIGEAGHTVP